MTVSKNPFEDDNFAQHIGIELIETTTHGARAKMPIRDYHMNGYHMVQGGAIFTLAVWTFAVAANAGGKMAVGITATISFLKAIREGVLYAEAKEVSTSKTIVTYTVEVKDDTGMMVASFQGMAYRKK